MATLFPLMKPLDHSCALLQYGYCNFNRLLGFRRLEKQQGRQAANFSVLSGVFTSVIRVIVTPFYGGQWQGGFMPAGLVASTANLAICLPPTRFAALSGLYRPTRKGFAMNAIRKGYSRPKHIQTIRNFPTFEAASHHIDLMLRSNAMARFNIQQPVHGWSVRRICT